MRSVMRQRLALWMGITLSIAAGLALPGCNGPGNSSSTETSTASKGTTDNQARTTLNFSWRNESVWQENFEDSNALSEWRFNPGAEFGPGAQGNLALVDGQSGGKALALTYSTVVCNATSCPVYAAAVHTLKKAALADALRFKIKNTLSREAKVYALVKDSSGQTLQYRPERCPFETAGDAWCTMDVDLRMPSLYWGGANNGLLQGDVTEVSIVVQALDGVRGRTPIQGVLAFDEVVLAKAPSTVSLGSAVGASGIASGAWRTLNLEGTTARLGVAAHFRGDRSDSQRRLQKAKEAGFGFVRTDLFWNRIEPVRGSYDFSMADQLLADASALGLRVLFILAYENALYKDGVLMSTDGERNAFAAYAGAAAARYRGRGVKFEIWNEQNSGAICPTGTEGFWLPSPNAQNYAKLVTKTMTAIRLVDPSVEVTIGGLTPSFTSPCELTQPTQFSFQYIDSMHSAGGLMNVSALGYHPYYDNAEMWGAELHMLRTSLRDKGYPTLAIWDTEWGVSSACPDGERPCAQGGTQAKRDRQAVRLARRLLIGLAMGLQVNVWYDLVDDGVDPSNREHHFGLYDTQFNAKPSLAAMQTLAEASTQRLSGLVPDLPSGMHAIRFQKGTDTVYAIWVDRGNMQLSADATGLLRAVDVQGNALPLTANWTLRESSGPIYLTYRH